MRFYAKYPGRSDFFRSVGIRTDTVIELTLPGDRLMDGITYVHVAAASLGLLTGAVALAARKGRHLHIRAGRVFAVTMAIMAITGGVMSGLAGKPFDALSGLMTCYMLATAFLAFRPEQPGAASALPVLGAACLTGYLAVEVIGLTAGIRTTDAPVGVGFVFATVLGIALWGDLRLRRGVLQRKQRTVRPSVAHELRAPHRHRIVFRRPAPSLSRMDGHQRAARSADLSAAADSALLVAADQAAHVLTRPADPGTDHPGMSSSRMVLEATMTCCSIPARRSSLALRYSALVTMSRKAARSG